MRTGTSLKDKLLTFITNEMIIKNRFTGGTMKTENFLLKRPVLITIIALLVLVTIITSFKLSDPRLVRYDGQENISVEAAKKNPSIAPVASLRIALAQVRRCVYINEGIRKIDSILSVCSLQNVDIVCFPETYIPGLRGGGDDSMLPPPDQPAMEKALKEIERSCGKYKVAAIVGMEWLSISGLENRAFVISDEGKLLGHQTKNQITPGGEEKHYVPEDTRSLFVLKGVTFGIVICHEGWRFPETVRWAAVRGAKIVFQPQVTGGNEPGIFKPKPWGDSYYEMAMVLRSKENSIYFASVNECMNKQNSSTSLIDPEGNMIDHLPCGIEAIMIKDIDPAKATGFYASRYRPERYKEAK
jgi:predicted amidohydrolase